MNRRALLLAAGSLALPASACLSTRGPVVPVGAKAPDFSLRAHDGKQVTLDALVARGPAALVFYRGYW